jgi:molybdopterin-dependent oxidoreductase alpha subunit
MEVHMSQLRPPSQPQSGGGLPLIQYWAEQTLSSEGWHIWQTLRHKSACLSCAWGTGGQAGGFVNEVGEHLQRCAKSVEAIASELQAGIKPDFFQTHSLDDLQTLTSQEANQLGRFSYPVIRRAGETHYQPIAWSDLYNRVETAFRRSPDRLASYSSGRSSNEAAYLLQLMMRSLGSNHLADCSDLCHVASGVGLSRMFGSGTSMVSLESLKQSDCVVLVGSNAPANHPRLMNELIQLRDRGGKVIVINPIIEVGLVRFASPAYPLKSLLQGSEIASLYLQPIPGSDTALFVGIQKALLETGLAKLGFLEQYAENWQAVVEHAQQTSWDDIIATCGITQTEIQLAAEMIAASEAVVFAWAMGITQHANGVDNVSSIANTALMTGNVGKPGAGTMPIRGHSNVQGFGSMGVTVRLKKEIQQALETLLQKPLSRTPGYDTRGLIEACDRKDIDTLLCLGGNLYAANPDLTQAKRALGHVQTIIYLSTKPNLGHFHGLAAYETIIVPVLTRFENPHYTTCESGNNFVRLNDPGKTHLDPAGVVAEVNFLCELAHRLHGDSPVNWKQLHNTEYIRKLIAQTIPGYENIADIDQTKAEFTISGRVFSEPHFPTPSGKARMVATPLPSLVMPTPEDFGFAPDHPGRVLILSTGRSYGQHNTVVYQTRDRYRNMPHRHCILMNPDDVKALGWQEHQRINVRGEAGELQNIEIIFGNTLAGTALMFYPEVNVLFKAHIDPQSGTPAYKRVPVFVY